jgi:integration host factor subunit alpha
MPGQNTSRSTMTKADIIEKVYQKIGFSKKEASESSINSKTFCAMATK